MKISSTIIEIQDKLEALIKKKYDISEHRISLVIDFESGEWCIRYYLRDEVNGSLTHKVGFNSNPNYNWDNGYTLTEAFEEVLGNINNPSYMNIVIEPLVKTSPTCDTSGLLPLP